MMLAAILADNGGFGALGILAVILYFLPTICGWRKDNRGAIFALNLFLGWTVIGWVAAFVWALTVEASANDHRASRGESHGRCRLCDPSEQPSAGGGLANAADAIFWNSNSGPYARPRHALAERSDVESVGGVDHLQMRASHDRGRQLLPGLRPSAADTLQRIGVGTRTPPYSRHNRESVVLGKPPDSSWHPQPGGRHDPTPLPSQ